MGVKYQDSVNQPLQEQFLFLSFFLFCKGEGEELGGGGTWTGTGDEGADISTYPTGLSGKTAK